MSVAAPEAAPVKSSVSFAPVSAPEVISSAPPALTTVLSIAAPAPSRSVAPDSIVMTS